MILLVLSLELNKRKQNNYMGAFPLYSRPRYLSAIRSVEPVFLEDSVN